MRQTIRFIRKNRLVELSDVAPTTLLLDYLRETEGATGTKEGCGEGDCGACTVALGRMRHGELVYEPVNACIQLLGQVDGCEVVTIEDLAAPDGTLHPIQHAMVENHGSQCGFCTPGFVMALFAMYHATSGKVTRNQVNDWIAGNLCRCTGYRPIVDAAIQACNEPRRDRFRTGANDMSGVLEYLADGEDVFVGDDTSFFAAPASLDALAALYEKHQDATIIAGATDVGLWITKQFRPLRKIIHGELLRRLGSKQVRASGTMGGNIANGSPIGDSPPLLIALDAQVDLRKGQQMRTLPLEEFFISYGKQARMPGELVTAIRVPRLGDGQVFRCFKVTKRFDQDISSVMGAFRLTIDEDGMVTDARLAYGGMAEIPRRARNAEQSLVGSAIRDSHAWADAFAALRDDFKPIDDHRASSRYRAEAAHAILGKALIEAAGTSSDRTRVVGVRQEA